MSTHNSKVFEARLKNFASTEAKVKILAILKQVAKQLVDIIDGNFSAPYGTDQFPVWSANLHDATGVGVYSDGAIKSFIPTKRATVAQHDGSKAGIWGSDLLQSAIQNSSAEYGRGTWIVLFSTVPYAYKINANGSKIGRGKGYFKVLSQSLWNDVIANLKPITT